MSDLTIKDKIVLSLAFMVSGIIAASIVYHTDDYRVGNTLKWSIYYVTLFVFVIISCLLFAYFYDYIYRKINTKSIIQETPSDYKVSKAVKNKHQTAGIDCFENKFIAQTIHHHHARNIAHISDSKTGLICLFLFVMCLVLLKAELNINDEFIIKFAYPVIISLAMFVGISAHAASTERASFLKWTEEHHRCQRIDYLLNAIKQFNGNSREILRYETEIKRLQRNRIIKKGERPENYQPIPSEGLFSISGAIEWVKSIFT